MEERLMREAAEVLFAARCMELGYSVSMPFSGSSPYDLIVDCMGTLKRVQIKTTDKPIQGRFTFTLRRRGGNSGNKKIKYTEEDCDLIVLHPLGTDYFVFVPPEVFTTQIKFCLSPNKDKDLINNFDLLCTNT